MKNAECGVQNGSDPRRGWCASGILQSPFRIPHLKAALAQLPEALRSERRGWGWKSLTRHDFAHVFQRRDAPLKRAQCRRKSGRGHQPRVAQCRGVPLKPERLQVRVLPRGPIWNVTRTSEPGLGANECVPSGKWCKSTAFRHCLVDIRWLSVERQKITQLDFFRVHQLSTLITQVFRKRA